jgi:hypothetical protein
MFLLIIHSTFTVQLSNLIHLVVEVLGNTFYCESSRNASCCVFITISPDDGSMRAETCCDFII